MEEQHRSWDLHVSRLREKGWAQSRQDISPLETVASKSLAVDDDISSDSSYNDPSPNPDALDFVFETIEEYVCGHEPMREQGADWDRDHAGRGHINESKSEVWTLHKLGEVQTRGSVADRIKAFETNSAAPSTPRANEDRPVNRNQALPRSTSPVSRWRKPTEQQSPGSPGSWQRQQMRRSPGTPNSWQRPQMQRSPGSPSSWQRQQMERSPGSLPSWMPTDTPRSDVVRYSNKVPVSPRNANSAYGTRSEKKQPIPAWPEKLNDIPRKPASQDSIFARILKDSETESSGLSFVSYYEKEGIYVSKIRSTSKFKKTDLKRGMKIVRINGVRAPGRVKDVIKMIQSAKRVVEIEAIKDDSIEFVAKEKSAKKASTAKKSASREEPRRSRSPSKRERQAPEETVQSDEKPQNEELGIADALMLSMGYVPNKPVEEPSIERKDSSASIASLDRSEIPEKPKNRKVHAMVFKKTRRDKIGISFVSFKKKRGVYIYEIYEDSKFQRTGLQVGMKVLTINRLPCPGRVSETLAMVKDIEGQLIITAVSPSDEQIEVTRGGGSVKQQPVLVGADGKPKVQTLNKLGKNRLRKPKCFHQIAREEPEVSEGQILNRRERKEILGEHTWMDDEQCEQQITTSFSQDSQTTSSTCSEEQQADDNSSWWGSSLGSVFGG